MKMLPLASQYLALYAVVSELDCKSRGSIQGKCHTFVVIDHETLSKVIILPLIQKGLLSVTRKSMSTKYWLVKLAQEKCG